MTSAKISLFSNDVRMLSAECSKQSELYEFRFFGKLDRENPLVLDDLNPEFRSWIAVAVRSGSVTVELEPSTAAVAETDEPEIHFVSIEDFGDTGTVLRVVFNEPMNTEEPSAIDFNVSVDGSPIDTTFSSWTSSTVLELTTDVVVLGGETVLLTIEAGAVRDIAGTFNLEEAGISVRNNSTRGLEEGSVSPSASQAFTVEPGLPLLVLSPETYEVAPDVTITSVGASADIEVYVFTSDLELSPLSPAFLVLNAGTGVTEDAFGGGVSSWRDTRANSLAPLEFPWSDSAEPMPVLIESDPDFAGKPSISFADSGEGRFLYSGTSAALFDFMNGGEEFTVMAIMSAPDDALDDFSALNSHQGIWGTPGSGGQEGGHALIESGYRHMTSFGQTFSDYIMSEDELVEKPFVIMWHFDGQSLRVYWQGRWHTEETLPSGTGVSGVLGVGAATQQGILRYLRGKIADLRVYNRHLTESERSDYIAMAVAEYGVDDTEEQGFPWVADCVNMHRANRGVTWTDEEETVLNTWNDTRWLDSGDTRYFSPDLEDVDGNILSPQLVVEDETLGNRPAFHFNGADQGLVNDPAAAGSWDHLVGRDVGMTVTFIFYHTSDPQSSPLMSMGVYTSNDDGTEISWNNSSAVIFYHVTESVAGPALSQTGPPVTSDYVPFAIVLRADGSSKWWIDSLNLSTGDHVSKTGDYVGNAGTSDGTSAPVYIGTYENAAGENFPGAIPEMTTADTKVTNAQVLEFFDYARRRYGYSSVPRKEKVIEAPD